MSEENLDRIELVRRGYQSFLEGRPASELYSDDFQLVNFSDAPWQPSPGRKGLQEWLDFTDEITEDWGGKLEEVETLSSDRVLVTGKLWAKFRATQIRDEITYVQVVSFAGNQISRIETYHTREQALEAAGLRESSA